VKIENSSNALSGSIGLARPSGTAKASVSSAASNTSDVRLSGASTELQASAEAPPIDSARISEIKQAISDGRFTINAGAIADRLIASARDLIDSQRRA
jgi:negative regulator of flagellin synthesis FlgM